MKDNEQTINVTVENGVKELIIRHGEAPEVNEPVQVDVSGGIKSPGAYVLVRGTDPQKNVVIYSYEKGTIKFCADPRDILADKVQGNLNESPDLSQFGINQQKTWGLKELAQHLRMNRIHFADREENHALVTALNGFKAKVETTLEQTQDNRGNRKQALDKTIQTDLPTMFKLAVPLFIGYEKVEFGVEICFDTTESTVKVWLESPELKELIHAEKRAIINEELKHFEGLVIIEQ